MTYKFYEKTVHLVRRKSTITCSMAAFEFAVSAVNIVRHKSTATAPINFKSGDGDERSTRFFDDSSKTFGSDLHAVINKLLDDADVADGEPEFRPFVIGIGELQRIADFALEGAFEAVW